jgi:hypothetical protein
MLDGPIASIGKVHNDVVQIHCHTSCNTTCEKVTMADTVIYCLAQSVRSKLSQEASSKYQDLRRIVGHANMLDYLTAELINLGYEHDNTDDADFTEAVPEENESATLLGDYYWTDQNIYVSNEDQDSLSSEDSEDSEEADSCEYYASDSAESDSAESYEGEDNDNGTDGDYGYSSTTYASKAHSPQAAIRVSVQEIDEIDEEMELRPRYDENAVVHPTSRQKASWSGSWYNLYPRMNCIPIGGNELPVDLSLILGNLAMK